MVRCCKDCEKREVGCHSTCEEYIRQSEETKKINELKWKEKHTYDDHIDRVAKFRKTRKW